MQMNELQRNDDKLLTHARLQKKRNEKEKFLIMLVAEKIFLQKFLMLQLILLL